MTNVQKYGRLDALHKNVYNSPYGYFWNGFDITDDIMEDRHPLYVNLDYADIKVYERKYTSIDEYSDRVITREHNAKENLKRRKDD